MTCPEAIKSWERVVNLPLLYKTLSNIPPDNICPEQKDVFNAFKLCSLNNCKVVFLGQDPYPQKGVATGILFGNKADTKEKDLSPSLKVIKESAIDFTKPHNYPIEFDITLESWAKQGILMINSALTVQTGYIGSHTALWRPFISQFLKNLSEYQTGIVYVLFGKQAQTFEPYINKNHNHILKENHPAYYARLEQPMPSELFYEINRLLYGQYGEKIVWYTEYNNA